MPPRLSVIAAGAVHAYLEEIVHTGLLADFALDLAFAPAGAITERVRERAGHDVVISSMSSLDSLSTLGMVISKSVTVLGETELAVCTRDGNPTPRIENESALPALMLEASSIHIPAFETSTAGAHMNRIIERLGLHHALFARLRTHPNGAATMRAIAESADPTPLGFTQRSEIVSAPGTLLGDCLPGSFGLRTRYAAAITSHSATPDVAQRLIDILTSTEQDEFRRIFGFSGR